MKNGGMYRQTTGWSVGRHFKNPLSKSWTCQWSCKLDWLVEATTVTCHVSGKKSRGLAKRVRHRYGRELVKGWNADCLVLLGTMWELKALYYNIYKHSSIFFSFWIKTDQIIIIFEVVLFVSNSQVWRQSNFFQDRWPVVQHLS